MLFRSKQKTAYEIVYRDWSSDVCSSDLPEILSKQPHVAYKVDNADPYLEDADRIIFGPEALGDNVRLAFIIKDDAIIELYEEK